MSFTSFCKGITTSSKAEKLNTSFLSNGCKLQSYIFIQPKRNFVHRNNGVMRVALYYAKLL